MFAAVAGIVYGKQKMTIKAMMYTQTMLLMTNPTGPLIQNQPGVNTERPPIR